MGGAATSAERDSDPPRRGSRTVSQKMSPSSRPGSPTAMMVTRQPYWTERIPPAARPISMPAFGPTAIRPIAVERRAGGKMSAMME